MTKRFSLSSTTCQAPCKAQAVWGDRPRVLTPAGASPRWVPRTRSHWLSGHAGEQVRFCRWGDRDAESPPGWRRGSPSGSRFHSQRLPVQSRGPCPRLGPGRPSSPLHQPCSSPAFCSIPPLLKSFQNGSSAPLPTSATYKRHRKLSLAGPSQCVSPVARASPTSEPGPLCRALLQAFTMVPSPFPSPSGTSPCGPSPRRPVPSPRPLGLPLWASPAPRDPLHSRT